MNKISVMAIQYFHISPFTIDKIMSLTGMMFNCLHYCVLDYFQ